MKNLENYGVQALDAKEIREVDGGLLGIILSSLTLYLVYETLGNWNASNDALSAGIEDGYNYNK